MSRFNIWYKQNKNFIWGVILITPLILSAFLVTIWEASILCIIAVYFALKLISENYKVYKGDTELGSCKDMLPECIDSTEDGTVYYLHINYTLNGFWSIRYQSKMDRCIEYISSSDLSLFELCNEMRRKLISDGFLAD